MTDSKQGPVDDAELAQRLVDQAKADGVSLTGPGGLLGGLTKRVLETALEGELDEHLGYAKHDPAGRSTSNSRNGKRSKSFTGIPDPAGRLNACSSCATDIAPSGSKPV